MNNTLTDNLSERISEIMRVLKDSSRVLVASHLDPDGDSIGTQLAFASYLRDRGKEVLMIRDGVIPTKYRFLAGAEDIPHVDSLDYNLTVDTAVILECPVLDRAGRATRFLNDDTRIINIDHHQDNSSYGEINWIDCKTSSVGEMIFEFFMKVNYQISQQTAEQLFTAILTDTGRFRYSSTTPRTMQVAGFLIEAGANPQKICEAVYYEMLPSTLKIVGKVLNGVEFHYNGRVCLLSLTKAMLEETKAHESESEGLVDYTLYSNGVQAGALLKEIDDARTKVSLRSRNDINVAELASQAKGGGHKNAAGCTLDMPLAEAKKEILQLLRVADNA